jgi:FkbM family methyltransferase
LVRNPGLRQVVEATGLLGVARVAYRTAFRAIGRKSVRFDGVGGRFTISSNDELRRLDNLHHEIPFLRQIRARLRDGDWFFDVGANIGVLSVLMARSVSGIRCHGFEPSSENAAAFRRNVVINGLAGRICVHELAIGSATGTATLFANPNAGDGLGSLDDRCAAPGAIARTISIVTLDEACRREGVVPSAVKIDVEGWEWEAIRGMDHCLRDPRMRFIAIEVHPELLRARGLDPSEVLVPALDAGFRETWSNGRGGERHVIMERT